MRRREPSTSCEFCPLIRQWHIAAWLLLSLCLGLQGNAAAHVGAGTYIRVIHLSRTDSGLIAYMRLSFPLVVAATLDDEANETEPSRSFTTDRVIEGTVMHFIDAAAVEGRIMDLARQVASTHLVGGDGGPAAAGEPRAARISLRGAVLPFNTLEQAEAALIGPAVPDFDGEVEISSAMFDVAITYPVSGETDTLTVVSTLDTGTIDADEIVNLLILHQPGEPARNRQLSGLLYEPVQVYESPWHAALRFALLGAGHIWEGLDHLFFVMCLVIGAGTLGGLAWRVTGFTLGHSATLVAGFLGYAPTGAWFAPAVEIGIAASIIYAAAAALKRWNSGRTTILVTAGLGLLHGFGFSAALRELVPADDPDLLLRLAAFNGGVEVGQLALVAVLWPPLAWIAGRSEQRGRRVIECIGIGAIWVAATWIIERVPLLLSAL